MEVTLRLMTRDAACEPCQRILPAAGPVAGLAQFTALEAAINTAANSLASNAATLVSLSSASTIANVQSIAGKMELGSLGYLIRVSLPLNITNRGFARLRFCTASFSPASDGLYLPMQLLAPASWLPTTTGPISTNFLNDFPRYSVRLLLCCDIEGRHNHLGALFTSSSSLTPVHQSLTAFAAIQLPIVSLEDMKMYDSRQSCRTS